MHENSTTPPTTSQIMASGLKRKGGQRVIWNPPCDTCGTLDPMHVRGSFRKMRAGGRRAIKLCEVCAIIWDRDHGGGATI